MRAPGGTRGMVFMSAAAWPSIHVNKEPRGFPAGESEVQRMLRLDRLVLPVLGTITGVLVLILCGSAFALNPERHYEMVSPVYKAGFGVIHIEAVAANGESVAYFSPGAFAGAPDGLTPATFMDYLARRGPSGWSTVPLIPPASLLARWSYVDLSPSLGVEFATGSPGPEAEYVLPVVDFLLHPTGSSDAASGWEPVATLESLFSKPINVPVSLDEALSVTEMAADPDFCHILLKTNGLLLPGAAGPDQRYEFTRGCGGEPVSLKLLGVNDHGALIESGGCGVDVGIETYALHGHNTFNAVSVDGSETFFTDCLAGNTTSGSPHQLFVRLGGVRTVEVSKPFVAPEACREVPCEGAEARGSAEFVGASEDGSRVFFTAPLAAGQQPLVAGDTDASNNLYMARIGCPGSAPGCSPSEREVTSLAEVSHAPGGGAADVQGVLRVAPDGQRAYFVAGGDLLSPAQQQALEGEGRALPRVGAENLYVYDGTTAPGTVAFVGDLCSGREVSGSVDDIHCPSAGSDADLWSSNGSESQTAGAEGRFLVLSTYAQLSADDTNAAQDVYRYDAQTGALERVSIGEGGYDADGNGGLIGSTIQAGNHGNSSLEGAAVVSQYEMGNRAISEDGSRIVFVSAGPLSPMASNGLANVYEWHENSGGSGGSVSLISSGHGEEPVDDVVISPNGANVVFDTSEGLVPQDTDGAPDVYDARLGQGFAPVAAERQPCEGDACQGPLTNPAPLLVPGSVPQVPEQSTVAPVGKALAKPKPKPKSRPKCRRGYRRGKRGGCVKAGTAVARRGGRVSRSIGGGQ